MQGEDHRNLSLVGHQANDWITDWNRHIAILSVSPELTNAALSSIGWPVFQVRRTI
jgi:hypothetical protein